MRFYTYFICFIWLMCGSGSSFAAPASTAKASVNDSQYDVNGRHLWNVTLTLEDLGHDNWRYPIHARHKSGSAFGRRRSPTKRGVWVFHNGIDIACARGEKVFAATDGIVKTSLKSESAGNYIRIVHQDHEEKNVETRYLHLSKRYVSRNDEVKAGEVIGLCGSTGQSTSSHLHFEVLLDGESTNPFRKPDRKIYQVSPPPPKVEPSNPIIRST